MNMTPELANELVKTIHSKLLSGVTIGGLLTESQARSETAKIYKQSEELDKSFDRDIKEVCKKYADKLKEYSPYVADRVNVLGVDEKYFTIEILFNDRFYQARTSNTSIKSIVMRSFAEGIFMNLPTDFFTDDMTTTDMKRAVEDYVVEQYDGKTLTQDFKVGGGENDILPITLTFDFSDV